MSPKTKARLAAKIAEDIRQANKIKVKDPKTGKTKEVLDPTAAFTLEAGGRAAVKEICPTGSTVMDRHVLPGGLAWGRIYELAGAEGSGKTTWACRIMAEAQKDGALPILSDKENKFAAKWAQVQGLSLEDCVEYPAPTVEAYHEEILRLLDKHGGKERMMFVLDSVPALLPQAYLAGDLEESDVPGALGKAWSRGLAKISPALLEAQAILLVINQLRSKIGVQYGADFDTPAGRALKHYATGRFMLFHGETIKVGDRKVGRTIKVRPYKNHLTGVHDQVELRMLFDSGFDDRWSVLNFAKETGCIAKDAGDARYDEALANLGWVP